MNWSLKDGGYRYVEKKGTDIPLHGWTLRAREKTRM